MRIFCHAEAATLEAACTAFGSTPRFLGAMLLSETWSSWPWNAAHWIHNGYGLDKLCLSVLVVMVVEIMVMVVMIIIMNDGGAGDGCDADG